MKRKSIFLPYEYLFETTRATSYGPQLHAINVEQRELRILCVARMWLQQESVEPQRCLFLSIHQDLG